MAKKEDYLALFGAKVKKIREEKRMTLEELALEVGLSSKELHRIENGGRVTMELIFKLAASLGVDVSELLIGMPKKI